MDHKEELRVSRYIILYKMVVGLFEFLSGVGIALFGKQLFAEYMLRLSLELSEDPHDFLAKLSYAIVPNYFVHNTIVVTSLIFLGLVKIAGAIGLLYQKNWGVDLLVGLTVIMLPFQMIHILAQPTVFNFLFMLTGILIALYLIRFQPRAWVSRVFRRA
jgi:uncharacterized membrane protein (DUF2068 family)